MLWPEVANTFAIAEVAPHILETLADLLLSLSGPDTNPRVHEVLSSLVRHLHGFAQEVGLTHDKWRKGLELLTRAGEISNAERNEFVLISDVLGPSSFVDRINSPKNCTNSSVLGPLHILARDRLADGFSAVDFDFALSRA